jgi:glycosyltransferase involved in cell wall biosynthesis
MRIAYLRPHDDQIYDMPSRAQELGVKLVDVPERGPVDLRAWKELKNVLREFRPDILHAHDYKTNLLSIRLRRGTSSRVVTTMHGYGIPTRRLSMYYLLDRWSLPRMDHVVAVSRDLRDKALRWGVSPSRCTIVDNAIDADLYRRSSDGQSIRQRLKLPTDRPIIGAVGRLTEVKGFEQLISAAHSLLADGLDLHLIIVGDGEQRPQLAGLISRLGCEDRIHLLGHRTDMIDLYHCMDVYALSSLREGLPNVVLEAMAMEVPVVATRVAGVPNVIEHERSGLIVDPGDVSQLAASIARLLRDPALRQRLAMNARATIEQRFSFAERMKKIRAIYDQVLSGPTKLK